MKNLLLSLTALLFMAASASAQNSAFSLSLNPNYTTVQDTVTIYESKIKVTNLTAAPLTLSWTRVIIETPPGVSTQVCDKLNCYFPSVSTGSYTMTPSDVDTFKIQYNNFSQATGNAFVNLIIKSEANPSDVQTAEFRHVILSSSSTNDLPAAQVRLYPNPATDYFVLENNVDVAALRIFDLNGRQVARYEAQGISRYDLRGMEAGIYIIALEDVQGRVFQTATLQKK